MRNDKTSVRAAMPLTAAVVVVALYELVGAGWLFIDLVMHIRDLPHMMSMLTMAGVAVAAMGVLAAVLLLLRKPIGKYLSMVYLALTIPMIGLAGYRLFLFGAGSFHVALMTGDPVSPGGTELLLGFQLAPLWYLFPLSQPGVLLGLNLVPLILLVLLMLATRHKATAWAAGRANVPD
jgi:hypothetical protein